MKDESNTPDGLSLQRLLELLGMPSRASFDVLVFVIL